MTARRDAVFLLAGGGFADLAFRIAQIALPLVVLQETGSVAATGLAGGAAGVPVLLSPWWARRARQWVDTGSRLAMVAAVQAVALAMVPAAAALGQLHVELLILSGLLLGCGDALSNAGRSALLADTGDRWGPDKAVVLLTWQDGFRRLGMVVGPPIGALAVAGGLTNTLLWIEAATVLGAGLLAVGVVGERSQHPDSAMPSIRGSLVGRPDVLYGWIARGTGCLTWFAFTLGLSVVGAERGQPGVYLAAGMSGYGVGSVVGTFLTLAVIKRIAPVPCAALSWAVLGLCWTGMGLWTTPVAIAGLACLAGLTVALGIAAISMLITRSSAGPERRALLSGQSVVVNASSSAGMLIGGPLIAAAGAENTLVGAGVLTTVVALGVLVRRNQAVRDNARRATAEQVRQDGAVVRPHG
ncbi:MFS transporter [Kribbella sp. CA-293567]|uniref:MFS transporter n=1 Tax=Kribbella sp. CA-293567 TaxID=3002436 RepID=UPI0022DD1446|nr:MFS transporter [Kribbella sp. CA-293567]WBQ08477.1 MFS transporter [Kribbella sp. CA-293567]